MLIDNQYLLKLNLLDMSSYYIDQNKIINWFKNQLSQIRTGRVNSSILDNIKVPAWGSYMSVQEVATIKLPEPGQILLTPFDKSLLNALEKAIVDSDLGVNPVNDGAGLRLVFPALTEENRKERAKKVNQLLEEVKITVRSHRHDVLKKLKQDKEDSVISEDELARSEKDLQIEVDSLNKELEVIAKDKIEELMKI
jgi:ribosome recycling factor